MKAATLMVGAPAMGSDAQDPRRALGRGRRRKAISEMLAVIILLALAVVAGVLVYQIFMGKAGVASQNTAISIQSATISGTTGVMTITIQNTGSASINSLQITVYGSGGSQVLSQSESVTLSPGQSWSGTFTGSFTSGQQYTITVQASSSTGGSTIATVTVTAG
ncbi:MAG: CARDB domain-containing protein [Conexivisphaera sp.]|jgi:archaellum component FlaF (FlaF/FlaG flagellin family)